MAQTNRRKRRQIDPKTLKKRSQSVHRQAKSIVVTGEKEATSTGYIIPGHSGKVLETYYETLLPGTASDLVMHPKKDRVVRVLSGSGFVVLKFGDDEPVTRKIEPGDEVVFRAGTAHRFATTGDQGLELHVSQEAKYAARVEIVEVSSAVKVVPSELLQPDVREETTSAIKPRRGSKARMQQAVKSGMRVPSGQIFSDTGVPLAANSREQADGVATAASVMNAKPSMGRFNDAGAG